jgi:1,2-diacylglycerol 3-alpha-glucosyltransferase
VPTGIDVAAIRRLPRVNPRRLAGWPDDALVVASLGRLAPEKSIEQLVAAFERAARRVPRLRLLLIGGGSAEEWLRRRAGDRMHLTGVLPRLDALSLLKGADAFAFASRTETQGLVLAEALACGLPVVAVRGPAVAESVRDGIDGRIVAEAELADAMVDLAASGESRREMAAAAIAGADRFDTAHRIAQIESVYREV